MDVAQRTYVSWSISCQSIDLLNFLQSAILSNENLLGLVVQGEQEMRRRMEGVGVNEKVFEQAYYLLIN